MLYQFINSMFSSDTTMLLLELLFVLLYLFDVNKTYTHVHTEPLNV